MHGNPLETRPRSVALIALGPSHRDYVTSQIPKKGGQQFDEVWVVNSGHHVFKCDKVWLMDDLRVMARRYPDYVPKLKTLDTPIITCKAYAEFPSAVEYPVDAVIKAVNDDWFTSTVAYAIGYAILTKVQDLYIFGADFMYPGSNMMEPGADCCAYLLGIATAHNVRWRLPLTSTLMDSHLCVPNDKGEMKRPLYGYDYNPGDCRQKVEAGTATEVEKLLALKAPRKYEELTYGPKPTRARVHGRSEDGRPASDQSQSLHQPWAAGPAGSVLARGPSVLRERPDSFTVARVGVGAAQNSGQSGPETGGVDGSGGRSPSFHGRSAGSNRGAHAGN